MYGKFFASAFTGSMTGSGAETFAVWAYAIANADLRGFVELNPRFLAAVIGSTPEAMATVLKFLASPDPESRTKKEDGRRIVREGTFIYRIVNYPEYRGMRDEDARRAYQRTRIRDKRAKLLDPVSPCLPASAQGEEEEEGKEEGDQIRSGALDPDPATTKPITGAGLKRTFAEVRAREVPGTLPWQTPPSTNGKESSMAAILSADPGAAEDIVPTMELLFRKAKAKKHRASSDVLSNPGFAFGCWIFEWTSLREELHGKTPDDGKTALQRFAEEKTT